MHHKTIPRCSQNAKGGPGGEEHWVWVKYKDILIQHKFTCLDAFAVAKGKINKDLPQSKWEVPFTDKGQMTRAYLHFL